MKNEKDMLNESIRLLQNKQTMELIVLKEQFYATYESFKPMNLIKSTLHKVVDSSELKNNLLNNFVELSTSYLSKKLLGDTSNNPIKKSIRILLQLAVTTIVSNYSETIITSGEKLLKRIIKTLHKSTDEFYNNEC
jgi:hypothetical protein